MSRDSEGLGARMAPTLSDINESEDGTLHLRIAGISSSKGSDWIQSYDWITALQNEELGVDNAVLALKASCILERNSFHQIEVEIDGDLDDDGPIQRDEDMSTEDYFQAYGDLEVHELMLNDGPRMDAYRTAILGNPQLFSNKSVLDVGCGTGILSMWAAKAGRPAIVSHVSHGATAEPLPRVQAPVSCTQSRLAAWRTSHPGSSRYVPRRPPS